MTKITTLKKELQNELQSFIGKGYAKHNFIEPTLLDLMVKITASTGYEAATVISRRGKVLDIVVGDSSKVSLSHDIYAFTRGYNRIRVVHTHPSGDATLSDLDKSFLLNGKYDCICAVGVLGGQLTQSQVGFIKFDKNIDQPFVDIVKLENANYINKYGLLEKIELYEKEYISYQTHLVDNAKTKARAILVVLEMDREDNIERDLAELIGLSETAGVEVLGYVSQKRAKPDMRYFIGQGKLEELKDMVQNYDANIVIFDAVLTGSRQRNLHSYLGVEVIDRSMLILDIFAKRAKTSEGKLQVELAQLKYFLPRVGSMIKGHDGSLGGGVGVGTRGPGESKIETNRRVLEDSIFKKEKELEQVKKNRGIARKGRGQSDKKIVSIVGYTNSGKSTLMNKLSGAGVYEEDKLFATLDTTTRKVYIDSKTEILLIDTVGFINKLPHEFINAFSSTLEESVYADLLLHVVDASDPSYEKHIAVVNEVLRKIGADSPTILVYNKIDRIKDLSKVEIDKENAVFISARQGTGVSDLKTLISNKIKKM